jgi:hypothetical protein
MHRGSRYPAFVNFCLLNRFFDWKCCPYPKFYLLLVVTVLLLLVLLFHLFLLAAAVGFLMLFRLLSCLSLSAFCNVFVVLTSNDIVVCMLLTWLLRSFCSSGWCSMSTLHYFSCACSSCDNSTSLLWLYIAPAIVFLPSPTVVVLPAPTVVVLPARTAVVIPAAFVVLRSSFAILA